ncbi:hypothetical protein F3I16_19045 [Pseudomonas sp. L-22-4S-12]|uniref:hypothetical protein n=1 Tax=Pseudomonas sp. L-22-4S-12 TaxID=2610893 RepID=UPI00132A1696|nr:hypothetical protein [Pseudomonas sp. L-22-4S-12]MWV18143.1 hypothetical protein [Pseudomonas sp. L-22-4S-12]
MTAFRLTALLLALGLLAACDEPPKPPAPVPTPPSIAAPPAGPGEPPARVAAPPAVSPVQTQPAAQNKPEPRAPVRQQAKSQPVAKAQAERPTRLPPVKLDLRLPAELVEQMELGEPLAELPSEPLLPPLFGEKPAEPGPFQLNGRLITNDESEDYWDSVEGAELQFEFRN